MIELMRFFGNFDSISYKVYFQETLCFYYKEDFIYSLISDYLGSLLVYGIEKHIKYD